MVFEFEIAWAGHGVTKAASYGYVHTKTYHNYSFLIAMLLVDTQKLPHLSNLAPSLPPPTTVLTVNKRKFSRLQQARSYNCLNKLEIGSLHLPSSADRRIFLLVSKEVLHLRISASDFCSSLHYSCIHRQKSGFLCRPSLFP